MSDQSWIQWALTGIASAGALVSGHLYVLGGSRSKALHGRIDETVEGIKKEYATKSELALVINESIEVNKSIAANQTRAVEDHRILNEKFDDLARELHILMGEVKQTWMNNYGRHSPGDD